MIEPLASREAATGAVGPAHLWTKGALHGRSTAVLCAALFPILFEIYGDAAYAVLCAFTALAFLAALSDLPPMKKAVLAGLAIGAACSVKQTAALEAIVLFAILARAPPAKGKGTP